MTEQDSTAAEVRSAPDDGGAVGDGAAAPKSPATGEKSPATGEKSPATGGEVEREVVAESAAVAGLADPTRVRRAPRFGAFLFVGLFLAVLLAGLFSFVRDSTLPPEQLAGRALDSWGMFWLLLIIFGSFLSLATFGVVVAVDRWSVRRLERAQRNAGGNRG